MNVSKYKVHIKYSTKYPEEQKNMVYHMFFPDWFSFVPSTKISNVVWLLNDEYSPEYQFHNNDRLP